MATAYLELAEYIPSGSSSGKTEIGQLQISSIKGEVKKKHISIDRSFSCFPAHLNERDLF